MLLRTTLAAATAISLLIANSAVYAGSNTLFLEQFGVTNTANISQETGPGSNGIGTSDDPVTQNGSLNFFQFSNAGCCNANNRYDNDVIKAEQVGDSNWLNIGVANLAHDNRVNNVQQLGSTNRLWIIQNGSNFGTVGTVLQSGNVNGALITQSGTSNSVMYVEMVGSNNGYNSTSGEMQSGRYVSLRIRQSGTGNVVNHTRLEGDNNKQIPSNGYAPQQDIYQNGSNNGVGFSVATTLGSNGNAIKITETGNWNNFSVIQGTSTASTGNYTTLLQTGSYNDATVTQAGSGNQLTGTQLSDHNIINANFTGDNNGVGAMALGVAATLVASNSSLLSQGTIFQDSTSSAFGNSVQYDVFGSSNKFAFAQVGGNNSIVGSVGVLLGASAFNQVAVLQQGNGNMANFIQTGIGSNNAAISQ